MPISFSIYIYIFAFIINICENKTQLTKHLLKSGCNAPKRICVVLRSCIGSQKYKNNTLTTTDIDYYRLAIGDFLSMTSYLSLLATPPSLFIRLDPLLPRPTKEGRNFQTC